MIRLFYYFSLAGATTNLLVIGTLVTRVNPNFLPIYWTFLGLATVITSIIIAVCLMAPGRGVSIPLPVFVASFTILISILVGGGIGWL